MSTVVNAIIREAGAGGGIMCMFNPYEYTVSKKNTFKEQAGTGSTPKMEMKKSGPQSLKLKLFFDTYEKGTDVSLLTNPLWGFMQPKSASENKLEPYEVEFAWGVFVFKSVITNMKQKFTLFLPNGTPVRAEVNVTFTQHVDVDDYPKQNPTSGGGPIERTWKIRGGDRLDSIAFDVYGDATKWRAIAEHNQLMRPMNLQPGSILAIPQL